MNPIESKTPNPIQSASQQEFSSFDAFFEPKSVALIGATDRPGSVGRALMENLLKNPFGGVVYPVNLHRSNVLGVRAYPCIKEVPECIELAIIATPAQSVPETIAQCAGAGVKAAIIVAAGFRESGAAGAELERQILDQARRSGLRVIGPNCLGVMRPITGLNATFASSMARPGPIAFLSQSGALGTAILDWSLREEVGFSVFASLGSMIDVAWSDLIDYFGDDPHTQSIVIYMESISDPRSFMSAAREVSLHKPILVLKAGRTSSAAKAVVSHTGSMAGSDDALEAAFQRSGVLRVGTLDELFSMAEALAKQPKPSGPRLTILTNAGGPGILATDALIAAGAELAPLSPSKLESLDQFLPPTWSHGNPIDILGDADPTRYAQAVKTIADDAQSDGLLAILTPQAMTDPTRIAESLAPFAHLNGKPILAVWMGGPSVDEGLAILGHVGIPTYSYPEVGARTFAGMWKFKENMRALYETPALPADTRADTPDRDLARSLLGAARAAGRVLLNEYDSKRILAAYGIPTVATRLAKNGEEAVAAAEEIGYPVVLKLNSQTITHKSDVGGVKLRLTGPAAVLEAYHAIEDSVRKLRGAEHFQGVTVQPMIASDGYELIIGSSVDSQLGPVLLFGTGGVLTEVFRDRALALPPLNLTLARRMMERTRIYQALLGIRGRKPVDLDAIALLLVRFSQLVAEQPWIKEVDINPLLASPESVFALDARIALHEAAIADDRLPKLAIRPYPTEFVKKWTLTDGTQVVIRPVRAEDEPSFVRFHHSLSDRSVYFRYFQTRKLSQRIAHERLAQICFIDYDRQMALVAERIDADSRESEIIGVGRFIKIHGTDTAEFAIVVSDQYQRRGLGTELLRRLVHIARLEKLHWLTSQILLENFGMQRVCQRFRSASLTRDDSVLKVDIDLSDPQ
jgi:acetyltransferase